MKTILLISAAIVIGFTNCKKIDKLTQFDIEYDQDFVFSSSSPVSVPISISTPPQQTNTSSQFASENTNKDKIEEISLKKMYIEITNPPNKSLRFIDEIEVYINADGLTEVSLASRLTVPNSIGGYLEMDVSNKDIKEYLKKDSFTIRLRTIYDEAVLEDLDAKCVMTFFVDAKII